MQPSTVFLLAGLSALASADFFMSNTTVCMGAFPLDQCHEGVVVLSGTDFNTSYTCDHLYTAQDNAYINFGTLGLFGSDLKSRYGICNSGKLHFTKNGEDYAVEDKDGKHVGDCKWDDGTKRKCNEFFGARFYESTFRCTSSICE